MGEIGLNTIFRRFKYVELFKTGEYILKLPV